MLEQKMRLLRALDPIFGPQGGMLLVDSGRQKKDTVLNIIKYPQFEWNP